jgi:hypothetical protein
MLSTAPTNDAICESGSLALIRNGETLTHEVNRDQVRLTKTSVPSHLKIETECPKAVIELKNSL